MPGIDGFTTESYKQEKTAAILHKPLKEEEETDPNSSQIQTKPIREEKHRLIFLKNTDAKILNKILANQIQ